MLYSNDRSQLRRFYFTAWRKYTERQPLEPMERLVAEAIAQHPEYHRLFAAEDAVIDRDYLPEAGETNPFLHLGLHIGLREQTAADRPAGIGAIFHKLAAATGDGHEAEHRMMECLAEMIWQAQRDGTLPDEAAYLERLRCLL